MKKAFSLIEILIVVTIFALLGMLVTSAIALSIKGSQKSETAVKVRENLDYALGIMERQLRGAEAVSGCSGDGLSVSYTSQEGNLSSFACVDVATANGYVASGSARLTSTEVPVSACAFTCLPTDSPTQIQIDISSGLVSLTTKIDLRVY